MLHSINEKQMKAFQDQRVGEFTTRFAQHLLMTCPEICLDLSKEQLQETAGDAVERFRQYGFVTENDVLAFSDYCIEKEEFLKPVRPGTIRIVENPALSADGKLQALELLS